MDLYTYDPDVENALETIPETITISSDSSESESSLEPKVLASTDDEQDEEEILIAQEPPTYEQ